ncbi:hypothetical protein ACLOJK_009764 [Asimina triloba]
MMSSFIKPKRSNTKGIVAVAAGVPPPHDEQGIGAAPTRATSTCVGLPNKKKPPPHDHDSSRTPTPNFLITTLPSSLPPPVVDHHHEDEYGITLTHQRNSTKLLLRRSFSCEATHQIPHSSPYTSKNTAPKAVMASPRRRLQRANSCVEGDGKKMQRSKMGKAANVVEGARGLRSMKSLSELEVEEVQGFMDLGFVFDKDNLSPSILSIIPGLQERKHADELDEESSTSDQQQVKVARPYLSEAWLVQRPPRPPKLFNSVDGNGKPAVDVKEQLKEWARSVASSVHHECCT